MATSSRLKTVDGKYYATEEYVKNYIDENLETSLSSVIVNEIGDIQESLSGKANSSDVYTKEETNQQIINFFIMNTL